MTYIVRPNLIDSNYIKLTAFSIMIPLTLKFNLEKIHLHYIESSYLRTNYSFSLIQVLIHIPKHSVSEIMRVLQKKIHGK